MALDAVVIHALAKELSSAVIGGRIDRIQQPAADMLIFSLRSKGENRKLLLSAGSGSARVQLTNASFENPQDPPMFCMLLRKHLTGARILSVEQPGFERIITIAFETYDELGRISEKRIVAELIGRSANIILTDSDGIIIDCIRRMSFAGDPLRKLLPGMLYRLPPEQNKPNFFECDDPAVTELIRNADRSVPVDKWLLMSFAGLSPLICRELAYISTDSYACLEEACAGLRKRVQREEFAPYIIYEKDKPRDFSFMRLQQYESFCTLVPMPDFSALLDEYWADVDRAEQLRRRSQELFRVVRNARDRVSKKLSAQYMELKQSEGREEVRRNAELISANIYRIRKGQRILECENYYEPDCPLIKIPLDPLKSPQQNSAALFKQYSKLKGANYYLTKLIDENERQLDYLDSVLDELSRCEKTVDFTDIRLELISGGYIKQKKNCKADKAKPQSPLKFRSDSGFEILVGKNNTQNDELTCRLARRTDIWLHVKNIHGSHVIIRCEGTEPDEVTLTQAAVLAAYYSQGRDSGKLPVDHTMVRNVKKPSGALPGRVNYTDFGTIYVQSDEELVKRLKK